MSSPLTKREFIALMVMAFVHYQRLDPQDQENFDAPSYLAGLEHGYRERTEVRKDDVAAVALALTATIVIVLLSIALAVK